MLHVGRIGVDRRLRLHSHASYARSIHFQYFDGKSWESHVLPRHRKATQLFELDRRGTQFVLRDKRQAKAPAARV